MRIFSGIQPSGILHIGNYFGAIKQWLELQEKNECIFCIVNLHAITVHQEPQKLKENTYRTAALYLASGIDPKKSIIFLQSQVKEQVELSWILNTVAKIGELKRMTQFKEKSAGQKENVNVGLFAYPVLMAADILLYRADVVPVGEDQKQHIELAQTLAGRFNRLFGNTFKVPQPLISKGSARIMGLDNPLKKMSKSADSLLNYIALDDSPDKIRDKIKRAATDSGKEIKRAKDKPAISNLLNIYCLASDECIEEVEEKFKGKGYKEFKESLAETLVEFLAPIQKRQKKIFQDKRYIEEVLKEGKEKAEKIARETMREVKEKIGLL